MPTKNIILLILITIFSLPSLAFFHFEPGIGYNRGHYNSSKAQGIGLTLKLGAEFGKFFILGDVGQHDLQLGNTPTSTLSDVGVSIGSEFKSWRFWYTHLTSATLTIESGATTTEVTGGGMKLGIGGKISSKTYLNLEARFIDFTDSNGSPVTQFMDSAFLSVSWVIW